MASDQLNKLWYNLTIENKTAILKDIVEQLFMKSKNVIKHCTKRSKFRGWWKFVYLCKK